jgi:hypothetical protein
VAVRAGGRAALVAAAPWAGILRGAGPLGATASRAAALDWGPHERRQ